MNGRRLALALVALGTIVAKAQGPVSKPVALKDGTYAILRCDESNGTKVSFSLITVRSRDTAEAVLLKLRNGESFSSLVRQYSTHPSSYSEGAFSAIEIGDLREEFQATFKEPGACPLAKSPVPSKSVETQTTPPVWQGAKDLSNAAPGSFSIPIRVDEWEVKGPFAMPRGTVWSGKYLLGRDGKRTFLRHLSEEIMTAPLDGTGGLTFMRDDRGRMLLPEVSAIPGKEETEINPASWVAHPGMQIRFSGDVTLSGFQMSTESDYPLVFLADPVSGFTYLCGSGSLTDKTGNMSRVGYDHSADTFLEILQRSDANPHAVLGAIIGLAHKRDRRATSFLVGLLDTANVSTRRELILTLTAIEDSAASRALLKILSEDAVSSFRECVRHAIVITRSTPS